MLCIQHCLPEMSKWFHDICTCPSLTPLPGLLIKLCRLFPDSLHLRVPFLGILLVFLYLAAAEFFLGADLSAAAEIAAVAVAAAASSVFTIAAIAPKKDG